MDADVIIVGAGSAGCVLASRLSEDPKRRVMLLEAGQDIVPGGEPADIANLYPLSYFNPRYLWTPLAARWQTGGRRVPFSQGKVMGGGASVMGMWAVRGFPADYDEWAVGGAKGWAWADVLPFFAAMESDQDYPHSPLHGAHGPITIRRQRRTDWPPYCNAVAQAAEHAGLSHVADMNAEFRDGIGVLPIAADSARISTARTYLTKAVRARPNLSVETGTRCMRVVFEGTRAVGVEVLRPGGVAVLRAREIILSAGAIQSPALLMRSGVGALNDLVRFSIPVIAVRDGVGRNLQNHPVVSLGVHLASGAEQLDATASAAFCCLRMTSMPGVLESDLYFSVLNRSSWHYFGRRLASLNVMLHKPLSRGRVSISSSDALAAPDVDFGFLSDPQDLPRLIQGLRLGASLLMSAEVDATSIRSGIFTHSPITRLLSTRSASNRFLNSLLSIALPLLPALERRLVGEVLAGLSPEEITRATNEQLEPIVRQVVSGVFHPVGTCKMGAPDDDSAVVNSEGRVYGVENLRIVDASIMPSIPRCGTFLPSVMIAEKISAALKKDLL